MSTTFAATVLTAVTIASAAVPLAKRQEALLNPFGDFSIDDIPQRCRSPCNDAVELSNNTQCLSNIDCLCEDDDEGDDIGECFSCIIRNTEDEQARTQVLETGRNVLSEYFQVCTDGGRQIPEGTIDDEGRYFDNDSDNDDDWDDNDDGYNSDDDHNNNGGNNGGNNNAGNNGGNTDNGNNNNNNVGGNNDSVNDNADDGSGAASGLRIPAAAVLVGSFALGALAM